MIPILAIAGAAILTVIAVAHVIWAFGNRIGPSVIIPTRPDGSAVLAPGRGITLGVALLLFTAAFLLIERGGLGPGLVARPWRALGAGGVAVVLFLRGIGDFHYVGLFKRERQSPFARMDSRLYTPLVLILALLTGIVALRGN